MHHQRLAAAIADDVIDDVEPTIDETVQYLEWLMIWYSRNPSSLLAHIIATRLEALRLQERRGEAPEAEWVCRRLLASWRYLAGRRRGRAAR